MTKLTKDDLPFCRRAVERLRNQSFLPVGTYKHRGCFCIAGAVVIEAFPGSDYEESIQLDGGKIALIERLNGSFDAVHGYGAFHMNDVTGDPVRAASMLQEVIDAAG